MEKPEACERKYHYAWNVVQVIANGPGDATRSFMATSTLAGSQLLLAVLQFLQVLKYSLSYLILKKLLRSEERDEEG